MSTTPLQNSPKSSPIGFIQKYALPYYTPCLQYLIIWIIYFTTKQPAYTATFLIGFGYMGKFLPRDSFPILHSKQHNKNIFQVFPLVAHIIFTWVTVAGLFIEYPIKYYTNAQIFQTIITLLFLLPPSIDAAHELIHRPQWPLRILGFLNMALFQFTVYPIQHIYLHHKFVGTNKDPITSPKNQSLYAYTLKAFFSAHKFVFNFDLRAFAVCMATNWLYIGAMFYHALRQYNNLEEACMKVGFFLIVGFSGFMFLEAIEYIEHYGLIYRQDVDKKEITEISSWNSQENILHNWLIFRYQRHSDHHMNAYKVYTTLQLTEKMPRFPFSFIEGSFIAIISPLWFYVMNPYVDEVLQNKPIPKTHRTIVKYIKQTIYLVVIIKAFLGAYAAYQLRSLH